MRPFSLPDIAVLLYVWGTIIYPINWLLLSPQILKTNFLQ